MNHNERYETVVGCDIPGHPNNYAHQHDREAEGATFLATVLGVPFGVIQAALNVGGYVVVPAPPETAHSEDGGAA